MFEHLPTNLLYSLFMLFEVTLKYALPKGVVLMHDKLVELRACAAQIGQISSKVEVGNNNIPYVFVERMSCVAVFHDCKIELSAKLSINT